MSSPLRILYAAGPGDVIGTYHHWKAGRDDPSQVAVTYSGQFYDLCRELNAVGYVISYNCRREKVAESNLTIEHRPLLWQRGPGWLYHLGQLWYGLRLTASAIKFEADIAVVAEGTHWFVLTLMRLANIKIVPTFHCVLWLKQHPPAGLLQRTIRCLNARFFRKHVAAMLSLSNDITEQVRSMLQGHLTPIFPFLPTYRAEAFNGFGPPANAPPFRVFFAGRMERSKGVYDLFDIAKRFNASNQTDIEFDLCGDGAELSNLRQAVKQAGLESRFRCHGHTTKPFMREMYEKCHVVIVPTTSGFIEGFNKVVAEGVLAGRPVITSSVCPALEYVKDAVVEVPPDSAMAYADAILKLKEDTALYAAKRVGCETARSQFYDVQRGWKAALKRAIDQAETLR